MRGVRQNQKLNHIASLWALAIGLASFAPHAAAYAGDDLFQIDGGRWMSFDHYKDAVKRGVDASPLTAPPIAETQPAAASGAVAAPSKSAAAGTPAVAAPTRPLDLPPMPGLNKGFQMDVSSTEDDHAPATNASVISADAPSDIHLSDKNWQDPASIARYKKDAEPDNLETQPLDVRMTYLPNAKITPIPSPDHISTQKQARLAMAERQAAKKMQQAKPPAEAAACAAMDAYKKQQLDAIQSDRQTLKALQDAIASLGLQKQLGFMTGNNSALNAAGDPQPTGNIDLPASTSLR